MGRKDTLSTEYLSDDARFADICNYCLFDGQDVIQAEDLREMDTKEFLELAGLSGKGQQIQRIRDILKGAVIRSTGDCTYLILEVENQTEIHYAMPVRGMIYDGINYGSQVNEISRRHRKGHDLNSPAKFLSGFTAEDHLTPVVTITVYWGSQPWDGPHSLHEMMQGSKVDSNVCLHTNCYLLLTRQTPPISQICLQICEIGGVCRIAGIAWQWSNPWHQLMFHTNSTILKYVADYKLNLISPADITDFEKFRTSVGLVLEVIKHQESEREMEQILTREAALHNIEYATAKVIEGFTDIKIDHDEKEGFNMRKAWTDHYQSGVREGREQGLEQGKILNLIELTIKKILENIPAEEAADMLEENVTLIERIYDAARMCAPDYDVDKIYAELQKEEAPA